MNQVRLNPRDRRRFLIEASKFGVAASAAELLSGWASPAFAQRPTDRGAPGDSAPPTGTGGLSLPLPPVLMAGPGAPIALDAIQATQAFTAAGSTSTMGFGQPYLGPVIRVKRGTSVPVAIRNRTGEAITTHWHGLHVEGRVDGGPHSAFDSGSTWSPTLDIDQPASTLWYHSHVHGRTASQVHAGLAGMLIIDDPDAPPSGLPQTWGVDDIPLIVQDRAFDGQGRFVYRPFGPAVMQGFKADTILVNGAIRPRASVPAGLVRFRVLNASNARIYQFGFEDGRRFHQVASDGGLLQRPVAVTALQLAPAERAEIVVDFSDGRHARLLSADDNNTFMGGMGRGMMGGMMAGGALPGVRAADGRFEVMQFVVDRSRGGAVRELPAHLAGAPARPAWGEPVRQRRFELSVHAGGMGMGMGMGMGINGQSMSMNRIDAEVRVGQTELWRIVSNDMAHPFHIHGTHFEVLSHNGRPVAFETTGLKDTFLVQGEAELRVHFERKADRRTPYMYHCHILEHEDAGMMGQFTVS